jgi:hypothetical protein
MDIVLIWVIGLVLVTAVATMAIGSYRRSRTPPSASHTRRHNPRRKRQRPKRRHG